MLPAAAGSTRIPVGSDRWRHQLCGKGTKARFETDFAPVGEVEYIPLIRELAGARTAAGIY